MKIYTRSGDQGSTSLFGGSRVAKCDLRISAYGTLDELNATLGVVRSQGVPQQIDDILQLLQNQIFDLGAELANPQAADQGTNVLQDADITKLESLIDALEEGLPPLKNFILPGGLPEAAMLHLARCVCRRAEREIVALSLSSPVDNTASQVDITASQVRDTVIKYVNRVSDLLFVLARTANCAEGVDDVPWNQA